MVKKMDLSAAAKKEDQEDKSVPLKAVPEVSAKVVKRKQVLVELDESQHLGLKMHSARIGKPMRRIVQDILDENLDAYLQRNES